MELSDWLSSCAAMPIKRDPRAEELIPVKCVQAAGTNRRRPGTLKVLFYTIAQLLARTQTLLRGSTPGHLALLHDYPENVGSSFPVSFLQDTLK